ncbi:hypothetical protein ABZ532_17425 [Streptomyces sp. NPDC019396]|uniref:hypothetical protein n=1 Tax=Streptomyces sp. NPDC019396 TaxID=3154687 RepID=UPI0033E8FA60
MVNSETHLRLLPWAGRDGKPCYLASDGTGYMSRLADNMESAQLDLAGEILQDAHVVLDSRQWTPGELHLLAVELTEALTNVHRIAVSRGGRLPAPVYVGVDEQDASKGPAPGTDVNLALSRSGRSIW